MAGNALDSLPVAVFHGLVAHQLQKGADVVKVINGLLEAVEGRPLLEALGQLAAPVPKLHQLVVDLFYVDLGPEDVVVAIDAVNDIVVELVQFGKERGVIASTIFF